MNKTYCTIAIAAVLAFAAGCQHDENKSPNQHGEDFVPNDTMRASQKFMLAQQASGSRHDATLHAQHFNGKELSSLGEQKLDLMMQDDDVNEPFTVYLNLPKADATTTARQESVTRYLKDKGLCDEQLKIEIGENPDSYSPTAPSIASMSNPPAAGAAASESSANMSGGMK
jgi:hypothetical protein